MSESDEEEEDAETIRSIYECPVGGECDGQPAGELKEHLLTQHSLEELVTSLRRFADTSYEY